MDGHGVVAGADDAGDVVHGVTHGDPLAVLLIVAVDEVKQAGAGSLGVGSGDDVAFIGSLDGMPEVQSSGVGGQIGITPVGSALGNGGAQAVGHAVVHDLLREGFAGGLDVSPELSLSLLVPVGEVGVVLASLHQQGGELRQGVVVLAHAFDGQGVDGGSTIIGGVGHDIDAEDHIVDVGGGAVGELDVIAHGEVVVDGAVGVLHHFDVAHAVVGIVGAVVGNGLALDAVADNVALTVGGEDGAAHQADEILVIGGGGEEGAELLAEGRGGVHQSGVGLLFGGIGGVGGVGGIGGVRGRVFSLGTAGEQTKHHHHCQQKRQQFGHHGIHFFPPKEFLYFTAKYRKISRFLALSGNGLHLELLAAGEHPGAHRGGQD